MPGAFVAIPRRMNYGRPSTQRIGPWPAGVNLRYDQEEIGSKAVEYASNVDILPSGELRQRPSFMFSGYAQGSQPVSQADTICDGTYVGIGASSATNRLIGVFRDTLGNKVTFVDLAGSVLLHTESIQTGQVVLYNGFAYAVVLSGVNAGKIMSLNLSNLAAGASYSVALVPTGAANNYPHAAAIIKDRMWIWDYANDLNSDSITNVNQFCFSKSGDPTTFTGDPDAGFIKLSEDGNSAAFNITAMVSLRNIIYIFTPTSTWALSIPSSGIPTNGTLQNLSRHIGAFSDTCVATYDNKIFTACSSGIYEILNGTFTDLGFVLGPRLNRIISNDFSGGYFRANLSVAEDRLWVGILTSQQPYPAIADQVFSPPLDDFYIFNLKSRAWSSYILPHSPSPYPVGLSGFATSVRKVIPFSVTSGGSARGYTDNGVTTTIRRGALITDCLGAFWVFTDKEGTYVGNYGDTTNSTSGTLNIPLTIWTASLDGATIETASWKRYYAMVLNFATSRGLAGTSFAQSMTMTLTDHNGNTVTNATVSITTSATQQYYSVKQYTSLRARHIQYKITFNTNGNGPFSLLCLDILAKLKQPEQSAQVGG